MATKAPSESTAATRRRWPWIVLAVALVAGALGAFGVYWFLQDDAPPPPSLAGALGGVSTTAAATAETSAASPVTTTASGGAGSTAAAADPGSAVAGTWLVDTSLGQFSFEDATGSFVGFRVEEELQGIGSTEAVGRTPVVSGAITIDGTTLVATAIEADLSQLTTNDSRRDSRARGALDTDQFPTATFTLTEPVELGEAAATGEPVSVTAAGELTVHGVTRPVSVALEAQLANGVIAVVGSLPIVFEDYGVTVPSAPVVVSAEDNGLVELQLLFSRQG
jgi:polyisoprenoid-binding protein YceI